MSASTAAELAFGAEFALFLVAVAGVACAVRPGLLTGTQWARSALASGFLALATASFLRGALWLPDAHDHLVLGVRTAGAVAIVAGLIRWRARRSLLPMLLGVVTLVAASAVAIVDHVVLGDGLRLVAAAAMAGGLVSAARRSISARIAVDAAALVLGVVLVVAISVSVTVAHNVDGQAEQRYAARAASEADAVAARARSGLGPARVVAGVLAAERGAVLTRAQAGQATPADRLDLAQAIGDLTAARLLDLTDPVLLVTGRGVPIATAPASVPSSTRLEVAGDPVVTEALGAQAERQGVTIIGGSAYALAAAPITIQPVAGPGRFVGVVVVARPVDTTYLSVLGGGGERLSFALATSGRVVARTAAGPPDKDLEAVASGVVQRGQRPRRRTSTRFMAGWPVAGGDGRTVAAFVVSAPADAALATREALFRTLFLVALGSALVALVVAAVVGERIGRGLRTLTVAAQRMQRGALDTRVHVRSDDELGVLGGAFTSMARSIRRKNEELRSAAVEEATVRARLEAVVSGMSEALVAIDRRGKVIELNMAAEELLAIDRAGALGRNVEDLVSWRLSDGRAVPVSLDEDFVDGVAVSADLAIGEATVPVMVTSGELRGNGPGEDLHAGSVIVLRDVRREREVDDLKSSILASIGHELRTPLTPIKGYAGMLRDRQLTADQTKSFAGEIIGGVDQLERVVRQLTTFATIAAGRLTVVAEPVDVGDLAAGVEARWESRVDGAHPLSVDAPPDLGTIDVDRLLLDQALDEILDNAVKFSPDGGPITVTFAAAAGGAPGLTVTVADRGVGIAPDRLAELVDAFSQGDGSDTRRFGGLGLGLACADRIVRAHDGRVAYASTEHRGTTVSILLPMQVAPGAPS